MAQPAPATTDRLPWLTEVPRAPAPEKKRRRFPWGWVAAAILAVAVGFGAYWLATRDFRQTAAPESAAGEDQMPAAPGDELSEIPSVSDMTEGEELTAEPVETPVEIAPQPRGTARSQPRRESSQPAEPAAEPESAETAATPVVTIPAQPVVRGRIIQIGAYPTRAQADLAWAYVVKKWPYLASKPKLVSPIEVRSTDGKGTRMYRLQLATSSQAQSAVICQRLETSRVSCVVVY